MIDQTISLKKEKKRAVNVFFYILLSCAFLSFHFLPINPVYIIGGVVVAFSLLTINYFRINKFVFNLMIYAILSSIIFFYGTYSFLPINNIPNITSSILFIFCILLGVSTVHMGGSLTLKERGIIYLRICDFMIVFMFLDLFSRIIFSAGGGGFYDYKFGPFYFDSNFTGNILLAFFMFYFFLKKSKIINIGYIRFLLILILLCGTFSRAAIFSCIVSLLLISLNARYLIYIIYFSIFFGVFAIYKMIGFYLSGGDFLNFDPSFNSKFVLIDIALQNYQNLPSVNKFFGIGLNNFSFFSDGMFAHNIFITLFYEFGYLGMALFFIINLMFYLKVGKYALYLIFPFLICSFSLFSAYMPFFFIIMGCIYLENFNAKEI